MLPRNLAFPLHRAAQLLRPVLVQGPRSSGKTTLLRREFPGHAYISLDSPDDRARARQSPAAYLGRLRGPAIIDDLHRAPELAAHLPSVPLLAPLLLASSRRLSFPGATVLELHAPTSAERERRPPLPLEMLGRFAPAPARTSPPYPRWPSVRSFLDTDVRDLIQVRDMDRFESFLTAARLRSGELLDQQELASECRVAHRTIVRWLQLLDSCFLTLRLPPADNTFHRRLVRRPILHFLDADVFPSTVVSELYRNARHAGDDPDFRHWRDSNGFALPLIVQSPDAPPVPVAIAEHPTPADLQRVRRWMELAHSPHGAVIGSARPPASPGPIVRYSASTL
jgi:uncharacterized protein